MNERKGADYRQQGGFLRKIFLYFRAIVHEEAARASFGGLPKLLYLHSSCTRVLALQDK